MAAILGIVIQLGHPLLVQPPDGALLEERHGDLVLGLHESLQERGKGPETVRYETYPEECYTLTTGIREMQQFHFWDPIQRY